jgi:FkbM family methyltransferase
MSEERIGQRLTRLWRQVRSGEVTPRDLGERLWDRARRAAYRGFGRDCYSGLRVTRPPGLERIGTVYGGWVIPVHLLARDSICYCAGVGEDISFDVGLMDRFGCDVHAFDPTPRAIQFVERHGGTLPRFHFHPYGLWNEDAVLKFYAPADPTHVSHSILNLQKTDQYFEAPCRRLSGVMKDNGHAHLDLLKLDIEGAEYKVLESLIEDRLDVGVICIEYDEIRNPLDRGYRERLRGSLDRLLAHGYRLASVEISNYTLVRNGD